MSLVVWADGITFINEKGTRMTHCDKKVASQIAENATPSIWGNPTVTCVGSNAGVWSLRDNMEMLEVLSNQSGMKKVIIFKR